MGRQRWNQVVLLIVLVGDKAMRILLLCPTGPHWTPWETHSPSLRLLNHECPGCGAQWQVTEVYRGPREGREEARSLFLLSALAHGPTLYPPRLPTLRTANNAVAAGGMVVCLSPWVMFSVLLLSQTPTCASNCTSQGMAFAHTGHCPCVLAVRTSRESSPQSACFWSGFRKNLRKNLRSR